MSDLNSVILEGIVYTKPQVDETGRVTFQMTSRKDTDEVILRESFYIEVNGDRAQYFLKAFKNDMRLRIVGWLKSVNGYPFIVADHIEYMKEKKDA